MRIAFLGTGAIGVPSLQALGREHEVVAVFTQPDRPAGRDMKLRPSPVKTAALALGLPVCQPEKIRRPEALEELRAFGAELIVVAAYGQILPKAVLEMPHHGCLNVHASLLPRHRGASPIQAAILAGDAETGVTIMQMDENLDTGDMLLKASTPIGLRETAGALHDRLATLAPALLLEVIGRMARGSATAVKQDDTLATYAPKLAKNDGRLDWRKPAAELDRVVRAMTPWPGAFTFLPGDPPKLLKIHRAIPAEHGGAVPGTILATPAGGLAVAAAEGSLVLEEVQLAGGRRLAAPEFLRGCPLPPGEILPGIG